MNEIPAPLSLRCEHVENPLGLDEKRPRFSWLLPRGPRGAAQTAFQLVVARTRDAACDGRGEVWDSGRRDSAESNLIEYDGPELSPHTRYWWSVRFWNESGHCSAWSNAAWFETGMLGRPTWPAQWIGLRKGRKQEPHPARFLRGVVELPAAPRAARLYITARGLFEPHVNGARVGRDWLVPGWTEYRKRIEYLTYDVTAHLRAGRNVVGAILADGWYASHFGFRGRRQNYGEQPTLLAVLRVELADGAVREFGTGPDWRVATGPILLADLYDGETHDARASLGEWNSSDYDARSWKRAAVFTFPSVELNGKCMPPVRVVEELAPVRLTSPRRGVYIFDLGQNMVGVARLRLRATRGTRVVMRFGEMLAADGTLYTANLRAARATDEYVCAGSGGEVFEPHFTFHGFRYVEVTGLPRRPTRDALVGLVLNTDLPWSGGFACSDPLVNRLQENIRWSQRGNYLEVPTDCPQRNERMGWTGDAQVFIATGCFNMDARAFFTKWLRDLNDAQAPDGAFPDVAPDFLGMVGGVGTSGQPRVRSGNAAWSDAGVICPWVAYLRHGDRRVLEICYPRMVRWIEYQRATSRELIRPDTSYGDWLATDAVAPERAPTPCDLVGTAYFARSTEIVARVAGLLDRRADAVRLRKLHGEVVAAFNREYVSSAGRLAGDTQTGYLLALAFDLLPGSLRARAVDRLVALIAKASNHLTTGFVGTPLLCPVLSRFGRHDVAYQLLRQKSYPGWLFPVVNGATTMWERWNSWTPEDGFGSVGMNSFNHYAYGAIGEWLYGTVGGIEVGADAPGFKHVLLAPQPGGGLKSVRAWHDSPYGRIESAWKITRRGFEWRVRIPPNTTATVRLPAKSFEGVTESGGLLAGAPGVTGLSNDDGVRLRVVSGEYRFVVPHPDLVPMLPVD